jgi:uncharacterized protein YndB with AHSA1/START domain
MIDVTHHISSVDRAVGSRTLSAGEARTLTIARVYDTAPDDLWDACTNPDRISRWFMPISGDLRPGGRFELEGNASGTIERCEPPHSVDATWEYGGQVSWIELRLTPEPGGGTRFALEHIAHVGDDMWAQYGPGAVGVGWDGGVLGLTLHLAGGEPLDRGAVEAWQASDEGRRFFALASERWADASIAAGTDAAAAQTAAARTTAFYTGEEVPSTRT